MVDNNERDTLKILMCSDIHEAWANIEKVCSRKVGAYDFVFVSGD